VIDRIAVVSFRMDNGGGNGAGCFKVKIWADTAKFTLHCKHYVGSKVNIADSILEI